MVRGHEVKVSVGCPTLRGPLKKSSIGSCAYIYIYVNGTAVAKIGGPSLGGPPHLWKQQRTIWRRLQWEIRTTAPEILDYSSLRIC